jgi:hypothetical protein
LILDCDGNPERAALSWSTERFEERAISGVFSTEGAEGAERLMDEVDRFSKHGSAR